MIASRMEGDGAHRVRVRALTRRSRGVCRPIEEAHSAVLRGRYEHGRAWVEVDVMHGLRMVLIQLVCTSLEDAVLADKPCVGHHHRSVGRAQRE
eukprot:scaffold194306_cov33-Tisochrysis_lutea.AAC.2